MKRKWFGFTVTLVLSGTLLLAGCSQKTDKGGASSPAASGTASNSSAPNSPASGGKEIDLTMLSSWSTDTDRGKALGTVISGFNQKNAGKIKVNLDINPDWPTYQEKVKTMIAAGQAPDLFNYNFNPYDLSRQKSGKLLDFTPYMDSAWKARFSEDDIKALTVDGKLTSVPFEKAGILFYYNKELFTKAGIAEFPKTWDEFFADCEKLKAAGITPISLMTADDAWHTTNVFTYFAASLGSTSIFDTGKPLDTPEVVKAAEYLKKLFTYSTPDALGGNYSISSNNFLAGKTAMIVDGPWQMGSFKEDFSAKIGIAAAPSFGDGKVKPGYTVSDAYTPWAAGKQASKEKEAAIVEFMKYMTSEESSKTFTLVGHILLSAKEDLTKDELAKAGPVFSQYLTVNNQAPESIVNVVRTLKPAAISKLPSIIEKLALGKSKPADFAKELQAANQ